MMAKHRNGVRRKILPLVRMVLSKSGSGFSRKATRICKHSRDEVVLLERCVPGSGTAFDGGSWQATDTQVVADELQQAQFLLA
jgi:hypothetical protein